MRVAVVGSRSISEIDIDRYVSEADEIVSGGAIGVDRCAAEYARANGLMLTEFLPEYARYGRAAPIIRNKKIVDYADRVVVFWDGHSKGSEAVIRYAKKVGKPIFSPLNDFYSSPKRLSNTLIATISFLLANNFA